MTETLIEDETIRLRALRSDDAGAHLAGCDRIIIDRLGAGSQSTRDEVSRWLRQNAQAWVNCSDTSTSTPRIASPDYSPGAAVSNEGSTTSLRVR